MSSLVELKYIQYLSPSLERFKWVVQSKTANFRCPICLDSQKNKFKSRGYFYHIQKLDMYAFRCHNCGASMSFRSLLKVKFPHLYNEFKIEKFKDFVSSSGAIHTQPIRTITQSNKSLLASPDVLLEQLESLPDDHIAVEYCENRKIPFTKYSKLYYTKNFKEWVHSVQPEQENKKYPADERLVFLMRDQNGKVFGAQGRALRESTIRYSTVKFDESKQKIYGMDSVDYSLPIFVTEGIIDSLFIPNCVAICGGDVGLSLNQISDDMKKFIVILDNEPRSVDTVKRMKKAISLGCNVCFWAVDSELKDINEMIKSGRFTRRQLLDIISSNIYSGNKALVKLNGWKKI